MSNEPDPPPRRIAPRPLRTSRPAGGRSAPAERARLRCEIALQNPFRYPEASARAWRPWLGTVVDALAPRADSLAVRFVSDREIQRLNRTYRHHDQPTDVLSFPGGAQPGEAPATPAPMPAAAQPSHLGDVAVSVPTARRQAVELGHSVETELRTLLLHGILHCLGYDHESDDGTMDRLEHRWRPVFVEGGDGREDGCDDD